MYIHIRFLRRVLIVTIMLIFSAGLSFAQQDDWFVGLPIVDIVFSGLQNVRASELDGLMESYKGQPFNDTLFWEIQGRLYALEYFDFISPSAVPADAARSGVVLRFTVTERPMISRIIFMGNSGIRRNELLDTVSIRVNEVLNHARMSVDERAIINRYIEKGYPDVQVRSEVTNTGEAAVNVTFHITEGDMISISEFRFEGNTVFSNRTLRSQLSLKARSLINDGAFQEAALIADRLSIAQYYHDRGYIDAEVIDVTRELSRDARGNNNLILTFRIHEGRQYTFGGVTFEGNEIFSTEQLSALVRSSEGDTINARRVEADLQRVADLYFENGYINNTINREERRDPIAGVVSFHIFIVERGRAHIENIIIVGNEKTRTEVLLREIPLEPGDVFSKTKVFEAMRNLMNLQYFSMVVPETPQGSVDNLMDLVFIVEEQPTIDLQFGLTFSGSADPDTFPISGLLKWNDRNFRGSGNQLGVDVTASPDTQSVSLNYDHRWIFGLPFSGGFDFTMQQSRRFAAMNNSPPFFHGDETFAFPDGFTSVDEFRASGRRPPREFLMDYRQWFISLGFSSGYRWFTPVGTVSLGGGLRNGWIQNTYDAQLFRPFDPVLREGNNSWTPRNSLWLSIALDRRDIFHDPSNGYYAFNRIGIFGIFSNEHEYYFRNDLRAQYFITLFDIPVTERWNFKSVLAFHSGLSFIFKQPGRSLVVEEGNQLSVDGMFVGRGWNWEFHHKGFTLWDNWVELRFPLVPGLLAWDFFLDIAGVKPNIRAFFSDFAGDDFTMVGHKTHFLRYSFGGGLRFTIPQFPFRFSFAKRFLVRDGNIEMQQGALFHNPSRPGSGVDPVISFAISF